MVAAAAEDLQRGRPDRGQRAAWRAHVAARQRRGRRCQTLISNGCGASVGLEAGYTQIGSGIASLFGQRFSLRRNDLRMLVGCGAAAAIAAAFGAPLTGAFYAFELIVGVYSVGSAAPILAAVARRRAGRAMARRRAVLASRYRRSAPSASSNIWR